MSTFSFKGFIMTHINYDSINEQQEAPVTEPTLNRQERRIRDKANRKTVTSRLLSNNNDWYELYNIKGDMDYVCTEWTKVIPAIIANYSPEVLAKAKSNETVLNAMLTINNDIDAAKEKIENNFKKHSHIKRKIKDYGELASIVEIMSEYINVSNTYAASIAQNYELMEVTLNNIANEINNNGNTNVATSNTPDLNATISFVDKMNNDTGVKLDMPDYLPPLELFVHENSNLKLGL